MAHTGLAEILSTIEQGFADGKLPLFVLGSGVSAGVVPLLREMTQWFLDEISACDLDADLKKHLMIQGTLICEARATRADAASFFSALQLVGSDRTLEGLWDKFSSLLTVGGFPRKDGTTYTGLFELKSSDCSSAHKILARLLKGRHCHVINLNYDPLLFLASKEAGNDTDLIPLYSPSDIVAYYTAFSRAVLDDVQPAVTNARGDVFFAKCRNLLCPQRHVDRIIEPYKFSKAADAFTCPVCRRRTSRLQLSFPGFEAKERLVRDIVRCLRRQIAQRVSIVVSLGLSGQWDPFLIQEIMDLAASYELPLVDVRKSAPDPGKVNFFEQMIQRSYPDIPQKYVKDRACLIRVGDTADSFCESLAAKISVLATSPQPLLIS